MRILRLVISFTLCFTALSGCGSGKDSASSGRAEFRILWPETETRLIPAASNSIKVEIRRGGNVVASNVAPRPAGGGSALVVFDNLPVAQVTANASAHPNADGTGTAQASGSVTFTVQANQTTPFSITMGSTIDHLEVTPPTVTLNPNEEQTLSVAAKDSANNIVLLSAGKLEWRSNAQGIATVDSTGKVRGVAGGAARITVTDTESNKSAGADITVRSTNPNPGGPVTMANVVTYSVPAAADFVHAGDFDGDGNADVIVSAQELVILYGRGDGTLEPYRSITTWSAGLWVTDTADMNGDGRLDILCSAWPDKVFIVYNNGGRSFATPLQIPVGGRTGPRAGDINGDGRMDMAVLVDNGGYSKPIVIFLNNGGGFTQGATYSAPQFSGGLTLGDLNGDSRLDIADGYWSSTSGQGGIHTLIGRGDGTFTDGPSFITGEPGNSPLIEDFTGDGRVDLVVNNYWSHAIAALPGQGGLNFGPVSAYIAAPYPLGMQAADFNRDGLLDIACGNAGSTHVSIVRSQGSNGFMNTLQFEAGGGDVRSVDIADFNKDGKIDLVTQNQANATVGILLNTTP